jgi:hypothetical protein
MEPEPEFDPKLLSDDLDFAEPAPARHEAASAASVPAAVPVPAAAACPSCKKSIQPNAVICTNCGYNMQSGKSLKTKVGPDMGDVASAAGKVAGRLGISLVAGGIAALIGGLLWGWIAISTQYEIGWLAWGIGGLAGFAMIMTNRNGGVVGGLAAAGFAVGGILIGKFMIYNHFKELLELAGVSVFGPYDILWAVLAVSTAFKLGAGFGRD